MERIDINRHLEETNVILIEEGEREKKMIVIREGHE